MRILFLAAGLLSLFFSFLTVVAAKSAVHEILGAVGFLTGWALLLGAAFLHAIVTSADRAAAQVVAAIERNADRSFEAIKQGIAKMNQP